MVKLRVMVKVGVMVCVTVNVNVGDAVNVSISVPDAVMVNVGVAVRIIVAVDCSMSGAAGPEFFWQAKTCRKTKPAIINSAHFFIFILHLF